jgi:hypothetical protein
VSYLDPVVLLLSTSNFYTNRKCKQVVSQGMKSIDEDPELLLNAIPVDVQFLLLSITGLTFSNIELEYCDILLLGQAARRRIGKSATKSWPSCLIWFKRTKSARYCVKYFNESGNKPDRMTCCPSKDDILRLLYMRVARNAMQQASPVIRLFECTEVGWFYIWNKLYKHYSS